MSNLRNKIANFIGTNLKDKKLEEVINDWYKLGFSTDEFNGHFHYIKVDESADSENVNISVDFGSVEDNDAKNAVSALQYKLDEIGYAMDILIDPDTEEEVDGEFTIFKK